MVIEKMEHKKKASTPKGEKLFIGN